MASGHRGEYTMKTIGQLKREIKGLPDDVLICESCNYELLKTGDVGNNEWYCSNEMCLDEERYPVS